MYTGTATLVLPSGFTLADTRELVLIEGGRTFSGQFDEVVVEGNNPCEDLPLAVTPSYENGQFRVVITCTPDPIDCEYEFSEWSSCSEECGTGVQTRTITIITQPEHGGESCPGPESLSRECNTQPCSPFVEGEAPFGDLPSHFNLFVANDFSCRRSGTEGRLAVGGNAQLEDYSVGCMTIGSQCATFGSLQCADLEEQNEWLDTVVVAGDLEYNRGTVTVGNVVHGGTYSGTDVAIPNDCNVTQSVEVDFAFWHNYLQAKSNKLRDLPISGSVAYTSWGSVDLVGTNFDVDVFDIDGDKLSAASGFSISNVKEDAVIILNVRGQLVEAGGFGFQGADGSTPVLNCAKTVWNFHEATALSLTNIDWIGTVLAPGADMLNPSGKVNGQVYTKSWTTGIDNECMKQFKCPAAVTIAENVAKQLYHPECSCQNGGKCIAHDTCDCTGTGFEGGYCETPVATGHTCSARWQCSSVSTDYNFVDCIEGTCTCLPTFSGSATEADKCRCPTSVYWTTKPLCLYPGECAADYYGPQCQSLCTNYDANGVGECQQ